LKNGKASSPVHDIAADDAQDWVIQVSKNGVPSTAAWFIRLRQLLSGNWAEALDSLPVLRNRKDEGAEEENCGTGIPL